MEDMTFKVVLEKGEIGKIVAHLPALPGCWSQGDTREEALANVRAAAELWLEVEQEKAEKDFTKGDVELINL